MSRQPWTIDTQYQYIVETAQEGIWQCDAQFATIFANQRLADLLGTTMQNLAGASPLAFLDDEDQETAHTLLDQLRQNRMWRQEVRFRRADGTPVWTLVSSNPIVDARGEFAGAWAMITDITALKQAEQALQHQALHDVLTGLPNRALLRDRLEQLLLMGERDRAPFSLLLFDLDGFKEVNDTLGHAVGDDLLRRLSQIVQALLRASDTLARLGGDEFAVLLPGANAASAIGVARRLLRALVEPIVLEGQPFSIGASVGIASYPTPDANAATLLRQADVAMYAAKRSGIGYATYTPAQEVHTLPQVTVTGALRYALAHEQLRLYYQPVVEVGTEMIGTVEALVRWQHPDRGLLLPEQFIPLAEQTGLIVPLTWWVLEAALRQCQSWRRAGLELGVSVNLSTRVLHTPHLADTIAALLRTYDVPAARLRLEVTETMVMADASRALEVLTGLHRLGVRLAIDDFGTGYSSLTYLKRLPVDEIKIDRSFVTAMTADTQDATIVAATIGLGHSLGLRFVAEGVETTDTWQALAALGCDAMQGFYISRALPADELEHVLRAGPWGI